MKLYKYSIGAFSLLILVSLLFVSSCSQTDDVKAKYGSKILIGWQGIFPEVNNPDCTIQPCACFSSFSITVSNLIVQRIDIESEPFDLLYGQSYTYDSKDYTGDNVYYPRGAVSITPGVYEILSITVEQVQASPDLNDVPNMNDQLNAELPGEANLVLEMGSYCSNSFNVQEGYQKTLVIRFGCQGSVIYVGGWGFFLTPNLYCSEAQCT